MNWFIYFLKHKLKLLNHFVGTDCGILGWDTVVV
jgi:hypothetical protein